MYCCVAYTQEDPKMKLQFAAAHCACTCMRLLLHMPKWSNQTCLLCRGTTCAAALSLIDPDMAFCHAAEVPIPLV